MENKKKATIKDICKETNLSIGTVSKYLNGGKLKEKNRILIEKAIEKYNYSIDFYAKTMITKKTNCVGVVIPEFGNAFYGILVTAISKCLRSNSYEVIVKESNYDEKIEQLCIKWFIERKCDAIICLPTGNQTQFYKSLDYSNIIFVDNFIKGIDRDFVLVDNYEISKKGTKFLLDNGHTNIVGMFINNSYTSLERKRGFIDAYKESNLLPNDDLIIHIDENVDEAYEKVDNLINQKKATAIFATSYISTLGSIFLINEKNLNVPEDISIMGFDNIMLTNLFKTKLTIINQPIQELAVTAVDLALKRINNPEKEHQTIILKCTLMEGNTISRLHKGE